GTCDQEEACDGIGLTCPPDVFCAHDVVCRVARGSGAVGETCPGNGPNCPGDIFLGGDTICRPANGICDPSESCAGTSPNCPADTFAAASTLCAPATSECQTAGTCDGLGLCQGVANIADGTACGSSENSVCTAPDTCFNGTCAPNHADAGILCGAPVGACQNAGVCSASGVCLPATNAANGTACGDSAQTGCTAPDTCTSGTCIDNHSPSGTPCDDGDPTTAGDKCNGNGGCIGTTLECPAPSMCTPDFTPNGQTCVPTHAPSGTTCNDDDNTTANDQCDGVGTCVGTDINCPTPSLCTPAYTPNGTGCTPTHAPAGTGCNDGDETTKNDICDGDGFCFGITIQCPIPSGCIVAYDTDGSGCIPIFATTGTVCDDQNNGTKDDQCTANGQCVGTAYSCPIGDLCTPSYTQDGVGCIANFSPEGTQCGSASTQCKHPEACDGAGSCLPETNVTNGTACGDQSNTACTNPDTCQTGICRSNHANSGVVCGTASDECKSPGVCDGSGVCGSQTNVPNGTACGDASDSLCTNPDSCLNGVCSSNHEPQGTTCGTASSECKQPETCNGAGVCGSETNLANGTPCGDQTNTTCDKADSCLDGTCASNFAPINTTCGTASGECKFAEVCNATGKCQPETNKPTGTACGSQADTVCSDPDFCKDGLCQKNHEAAGTLCGTASSECKNAETCNSDGACQSETTKPDGSACGSQQTTSCTSADTCLSGVCQTNHKPAGTPCGTASNECKNSELCDSSGTCLPETNKPAGTACGNQSNTACTNPDTCASGKCQSNHAADGTVCGSGTANQNCQISVCSTGSCSGNQTAANGTECSYSIQSTGATICGTCSSNQSSSNVSCMPGNKNAFCQPTGLGPFCVLNSTELIFHCLPCPSGYSACALGGPGPIPF
ncbi:MAG: hypothetical protein VX223_07755, partial [Myxococcota bacterium]|nr:hypothetical protein [Myxococcota bacterium]